MTHFWLIIRLHCHIHLANPHTCRIPGQRPRAVTLAKFRNNALQAGNQPETGQAQCTPVDRGRAGHFLARLREVTPSHEERARVCLLPALNARCTAYMRLPTLQASVLSSTAFSSSTTKGSESIRNRTQHISLPPFGLLTSLARRPWYQRARRASSCTASWRLPTRGLDGPCYGLMNCGRAFNEDPATGLSVRMKRRWPLPAVNSGKQAARPSTGGSGSSTASGCAGSGSAPSPSTSSTGSCAHRRRALADKIPCPCSRAHPPRQVPRHCSISAFGASPKAA